MRHYPASGTVATAKANREHQVFSQPTAIPLNPHLYLSENAHNGWNMVYSGYGQFMQQQANTP